MVSTATAQKKSYMVVKRLKMIGTKVSKSKQASSIQAEKDLIEGKERGARDHLYSKGRKEGRMRLKIQLPRTVLWKQEELADKTTE